MGSWIKKAQSELQKRWLKERRETPKLLLIVMCLATGMVWICTYDPSSAPALEERAAVDTYVPDGFQYVPIEVENVQALDAAVGSHAMVDLYSVAHPGVGRSRRLASRVPLMRAPLDHSQFGVLVRSENTGVLVQTGRFFVVVRNPKETGTQVESTEPVPPKERKGSRLIVEMVE